MLRFVQVAQTKALNKKFDSLWWPHISGKREKATLQQYMAYNQSLKGNYFFKLFPFIITFLSSIFQALQFYNH